MSTSGLLSELLASDQVLFLIRNDFNSLEYKATSAQLPKVNELERSSPWASKVFWSSARLMSRHEAKAALKLTVLSLLFSGCGCGSRSASASASRAGAGGGAASAMVLLQMVVDDVLPLIFTFLLLYMLLQ